MARVTIKALANEILETLSEYPEADPCEVIDELIRVVSLDEELDTSQVGRLRSEIERRGF